jgi:hypothetical protein
VVGTAALVPKQVEIAPLRAIGAGDAAIEECQRADILPAGDPGRGANAAVLARNSRD